MVSGRMTRQATIVNRQRRNTRPYSNAANPWTARTVQGRFAVSVLRRVEALVAVAIFAIQCTYSVGWGRCAIGNGAGVWD